LDELQEDIILERRTRNWGDVYYLRVGLKGTHPSKEKWIEKDKVRGLFPHLLIDEIFLWSKNLSVGRRDPKRIQRSLRTTQNSQRQLRTLKMAPTEREREKIQSSKNSVKNVMIAKSALQDL
jgi:hypothetical protein